MEAHSGPYTPSVCFAITYSLLIFTNTTFYVQGEIFFRKREK
jgi:hypothetical protein